MLGTGVPSRVLNVNFYEEPFNSVCYTRDQYTQAVSFVTTAFYGY